MPFISREDIEATVRRMSTEERQRQREYAKKAAILATESGDYRARDQAVYKIRLLDMYIYR